MSNFFNELKNRNVYKAATAYVVTGWLIMQVVDTMSNNLELAPGYSLLDHQGPDRRLPNCPGHYLVI